MRFYDPDFMPQRSVGKVLNLPPSPTFPSSAVPFTMHYSSQEEMVTIPPFSRGTSDGEENEEEHE